MSLLVLMRRIPGCSHRPTLIRTLCSHNSLQNAVIHIPQANVFRFGHSNRASPVFEGLEWTINEGENWAVMSSGWGGQKTELLQVKMVSQSQS
jgi:ABC-type molybdenum transport system ATPase subunit/photorepair protein PhrA